MAGRCVVYVAPQFIAGLLTSGMDRARVISDAIPEDAVLLKSNYSSDRDAFVLTFEHPSFPNGEHERAPVFQRQD